MVDREWVVGVVVDPRNVHARNNKRKQRDGSSLPACITDALVQDDVREGGKWNAMADRLKRVEVF